ncbi:MAG: protein translocase subunit SecF [Acutalibacteraceae bacterium]|nr:protein translocase subunit SecF [Acutalibacteraceae bacterium]
MQNNNIRFDFIKSRKIWMAVYALIIIAGIVVFAIFGANLSIDFKGGATFEYSFTGDIDLKEAEKVVEEALKKKVNITESTGYTTNAKTLVVSLVTDESVGVEAQEKLETKLNETFKDNKIELSSSNSVSPSIASNFFLKCLVAVVLASLLVILYVGIRFRKIGGVSAGMFALLALLLDCIVAFCVCIFFRLEIDSNFMSVILTTLGYSLNDTIVVYDRIRENTKLYPEMGLRDRINLSINQSLGRTIKTTLATFLAIIAIVVVAEFFGLSTLRSFAIPMAVGILSGCVSSICLSSPLWYSWRKGTIARKAKKEAAK